MPEQVKQILDKIVEWWKKFNNKQRIVLISSFSVVMIALLILAVVMTTPATTVLYRCEDYSEAAKIKEILDSDETISYTFDERSLSFIVNEEDEAAASMLLGSNQIELENYNINNVIDGSFTKTEADKQKAYQDYLEKKFADHISDLSMVESATVSLTMPKDDGTILSRKEKATAAIGLKLKGDISEEQAYALALYVATQLGNETTEGVTIIDQNSNVIYSGKDSQSTMSTVTTQLTYVQKKESEIKKEITDVLVKSHVFADVQVAMNLNINFDQKEQVKTELGIPNGMDGGAITQQHLYDMVTNQGIEGGVPGTDTNDDDTTYVIEDGTLGTTEISESDTIYDYDKTITTIYGSGGDVDHDKSSAMIMATKYIVYDEVELRTSGQLDDMTWEEFKAANSDTRVVQVDESYVTAIANATGFPAKSITFMCYEQPQFIDEEDDGRSITDYAQIIIAVLIFALLGYVVFRSTRSQNVEELKPEISVESLLESTSDAQETLEDIVLADERQRVVNHALYLLPDDMRVVIHLIYFEEMSYEEAAKIMKKNRKQVDNLLYRAKKERRIILGKDGELLL